MTATPLEVLDRWLQRGTGVPSERLAIATRAGDRWDEVTYGDLQRRTAEVAARLEAAGVAPDDRVGLLAPAGGDWASAFLGILRRGAVAVPFDPKLTSEELAALAARSRLAAAVVAPDHAAGWPVAVPVLDPTASARSSGAATGAGSTRSLDDPAVLIWTSGTTGAPKGVTLSLANLAYVVEQGRVGQHVTEDTRWLSVLPPNHLLELCVGLLPALEAGSTTFVARTVVPHELAGLLAETKVDKMVVVPMVLRMLKRSIEAGARKPGLSGAYLRLALRLAGALPPVGLRRLVLAPVHRRLGGRLRAIGCGGAPTDPEVVSFFDTLGVAVYQGYGLTEAAPTVAMNTPEHNRLGSVGRPLPGTEVRISGEGEILVRSPGVMLGYWDDEAGTREVIDGAGWLHTGDLGHLDADGYLFVTGRAKSLIVLDSGKKVQPEEVEVALARSELFAELCVIGWSDARRGPGEQVCAVVVPTAAFAAAHPDRASLEEAAVDEVRRLTSGLSGYKRPSVVRVHDGELPKTPKRSVRQAEVLRLLQQEEVRP
jgi:long-chain acyl-CoA synthetase